MPKKIRFKQIAIADARVDDHPVPRSHVAALDEHGRIWERFSDMPSGVWGQVEPPRETSLRKPIRKTSKRAR